MCNQKDCNCLSDLAQARCRHYQRSKENGENLLYTATITQPGVFHRYEWKATDREAILAKK